MIFLRRQLLCAVISLLCGGATCAYEAEAPPSSDPGTIIITDPIDAFPPPPPPTTAEDSTGEMPPVPPRGPHGDPIEAFFPSKEELASKGIVGIDGPTAGVLPAPKNVITDPAGRPVPSLTASKVARDRRERVSVLEDVNFIHHMAHFDREKIPDRMAHAKGSGAHGFFEVTNDITRFTKASIFSHIGKRTPIFVRFSTTQMESGSADTIRDGRGFATKFYTDQGNWDLVANQLIMFPIRDPILFPSLIRSRRRNPVTGRKDPNQLWDFNSLRPETTHQALHLFSDLGTPFSWRHMNGGGVHTFKLVNATGSTFFCKFHFRTRQGIRNMTRAEATKIAGENPDFHMQDLFEAIERGDFPSYNFSIQVMTPEQAKTYRFNPFDVTKIWLEEDFPLLTVGIITLNRNPRDMFTESELFAGGPGNLVPGIEPAPDPLFAGRSFAYPDTQRHRLGANFMQLPINRPLVPLNTFDRDGECAIDNGQGRPNYFPNSVDGSFVSRAAAESAYHLNATVIREDTGDEDNFTQAKIFLASLGEGEQERLIDNLAHSLAQVRENIRERALRVLSNVDSNFVARIQRRIEHYLSVAA